MDAATATRADRKDYGPVQLPRFLGLEVWQFEQARQLGLVPGPDVEGSRWSAAAAGGLVDLVVSIIETVGTEPPLGAQRCAQRLAERTGLEVDRADVELLAERGLLDVAGSFKGWPLYACAALDAIDVDVLAGVVAERLAWLAQSLPAREAADRLGWHVRDLERVADEHAVTMGRYGRYDLAELDALAADEDLLEQVAADKLVGPDQAAEHLEIRRSDFNYVVAASWVAPRRRIGIPVGWHSTVQVPLYRVGDLDGLRDLPGVDWEAVRAVKAGQPSPLARFARLPDTRATVVRRFVATLGDRYDIDVFARYRAAGANGWEIDWVPNPHGEPTVDQVAALVDQDPALGRFRDALTLSTDAGAAIRWARQMLQPGAAVVVDTETTDLWGAVIQIAVIDAATGATLVDTLVDPATPISPDASRLHGITDADVAGAPSWPQVLPDFLAVTEGRQVLAYNADYDAQVVLDDCARHGLDPRHLADADRWRCVMNRRSDWLHTHRRLALEGDHSALGDAHATRHVLQTMTHPAEATTR